MVELLDFYADWCGPCQVMEPIFEEVEEEYQGKVEFKRIDVDKETQKAGEFQVFGIPTFVVMKDGKEVDRRSGAMPKQALKQWLDSHI